MVYRLRDWLISRQRYWGCPIPVVHCARCGAVPVPEDQLPVELPDDVEWRPTGESPLKFHPTWRNTSCPQCGQPAERETDTMDTFMCSSWYHLRYLSPDCNDGPFDADEYRYWMPVDTYTGGAEHATMHLMYTRFFHKANRDMGIETGAEPMLQLRNQGQILAGDGFRMSKSRGNAVDPDEQVAHHGADTVRAFLMFGYRWSEGGPWNDGNIQGVVRWLGRVWDLVQRMREAECHRCGAHAGNGDFRQLGDVVRSTHQAIQRVTHDFEEFEFNTVVSELMKLTNAILAAEAGAESSAESGFIRQTKVRESVLTLLTLMAPVTPHLAEELWQQLGQPYSIHRQPWPEADAALAADELITLVVQVNGKVRGKVEVPAGIEQPEAERLARAVPNVARSFGERDAAAGDRGGRQADQLRAMSVAYRYGGARALVRLHERHLWEFWATWCEARNAGLQLPETEDSNYASLEVLLHHVLGSARGYLQWICTQLELPDPGIDRRAAAGSGLRRGGRLPESPAGTLARPAVRRAAGGVSQIGSDNADLHHRRGDAGARGDAPDPAHVPAPQPVGGAAGRIRS